MIRNSDLKKEKQKTLWFLDFVLFSGIVARALGLCVQSCFNTMQQCHNQHVPAFYLSGRHTAQLFMGFV